MGDFFTMIAYFWRSIIALFDSHPLQIGDYQVSFFSIIFVFFVIFFVVSLFWKGVRA